MSPYEETRAEAIKLAIKYYGGKADTNDYAFKAKVEEFRNYIRTGSWSN